MGGLTSVNTCAGSRPASPWRMEPWDCWNSYQEFPIRCGWAKWEDGGGERERWGVTLNFWWRGSWIWVGGLVGWWFQDFWWWIIVGWMKFWFLLMWELILVSFWFLLGLDCWLLLTVVDCWLLIIGWLLIVVDCRLFVSFFVVVDCYWLLVLVPLPLPPVLLLFPKVQIGPVTPWAIFRPTWRRSWVPSVSGAPSIDPSLRMGLWRLDVVKPNRLHGVALLAIYIYLM